MDNILSQNINTNKIFIIHFYELENRLDPIFYGASINKFTSFFQSVSLNDVAANLMSGYGAGKQDQSDEFNGIIQIRPTNIDADGFLKYDKNIFVSELKFKEIVDVDDILFNNTNSQELVGKSAILKEKKKLSFSNHITRIRVDKTRIIPDYLWIILNMYQRNRIFYSICTNWNNQSGVGLNLLRALRIPLPSLEIQKKIVDIYKLAYQEKQKKEIMINTHLASMDEYLLSELGINLPEKNSSLKNRMFTVKFSEITEGRIDPFLIYNKKFRIEGGNYENRKLKEVALLSKGQSITSQEIIKGNYPVIAGGQTSPYSHNTYNYEGDVITISASGAYSGYVWYHANPIFASDCIVIQAKNMINSIFLAEVLKIKQQEIYNLQQGAGQPHVYIKDIEKLSIPLPPLTKQNQIVNYIQKMRKKARNLQEEARNILEQAKNEVEQVILGNSKKHDANIAMPPKNPRNHKTKTPRN